MKISRRSCTCAAWTTPNGGRFTPGSALLFCRKEDGTRMFTDEQLPMLMRANSKPLRRLAIKLAELAQLDEGEAAELEKN